MASPLQDNPRSPKDAKRKEPEKKPDGEGDAKPKGEGEGEPKGAEALDGLKIMRQRHASEHQDAHTAMGVALQQMRKRHDKEIAEYMEASSAAAPAAAPEGGGEPAAAASEPAPAAEAEPKKAEE